MACSRNFQHKYVCTSMHGYTKRHPWEHFSFWIFFHLKFPCKLLWIHIVMTRVVQAELWQQTQSQIIVWSALSFITIHASVVGKKGKKIISHQVPNSVAAALFIQTFIYTLGSFSVLENRRTSIDSFVQLLNWISSSIRGRTKFGVFTFTYHFSFFYETY